MAGILLNYLNQMNRPRSGMNTGIVPPQYPTTTTVANPMVSSTGYTPPSSSSAPAPAPRPAPISTPPAPASAVPHVPPAAAGPTAPTPAPATPPPSGGGGGTVATGATSAVNGLATSGTDFAGGMSQPTEPPEMVAAMEGLLRQGMGERTYPDQSRRLSARIY
jgi:hypothetical protein